MNFVKFWITDYLGDTIGLSIVEHGAYVKLLLVYYKDELPFPNDLDKICKLIGAKGRTERVAIERVLESYFPLYTDGFRHNKRADEEIEAASKRMQKATDNGRRGGAPVTTGLVSDGLASGSENETGLKANHKPLTTNQKDTTPLPPLLEAWPGFSEAWREWVAYSRKLWAKKRKEYGEEVQLKQLKFLAVQPDPVAVIEISMRSGWQGLFEIKNFRNGKQQLTGAEIAATTSGNAENYRAIKERIRGGGGS